MQPAPIFLAIMWRYADGSFTFGFWYVAAVATLMIGAGVWSLIAPESFRVFYFNRLRGHRRVKLGRSATTNKQMLETSRPIGWGWGSPASIRFGGAAGIAIAVGFMTWIVFFSTPGVAY
jgi:hypothetical protein